MMKQNMMNKSIYFSKFLFPFILLSSIWIVYFISSIFSFKYGIIPRFVDVNALIGIFGSPFFHGNLNHIISNSIPLFILSLLFTLKCNSTKDAYILTFLMITLTGIAVWLFGSTAMHIGASGLVFSYFGFFIGIIFIKEKLLIKILTIILSVTVILTFSWLFISLLNFNVPGISWAGHFWGFVVGIYVSYNYRNNKKMVSF